MVHIIMPVKDSLLTAEQAIRAIVASGYTLAVYDDNSTSDNATRLDALRSELGIQVVHIGEHTDHPSPNYRWVLIDAQRQCLANGQHMIIIESDSRTIHNQQTLRKIKPYYWHDSGCNHQRKW